MRQARSTLVSATSNRCRWGAAADRLIRVARVTCLPWLPPKDTQVPSVDAVSSLQPSTVIAGHKRDGADDSPDNIEKTRRYLQDFTAAAQRCYPAHHLGGGEVLRLAANFPQSLVRFPPVLESSVHEPRQALPQRH